MKINILVLAAFAGIATGSSSKVSWPKLVYENNPSHPLLRTLTVFGEDTSTEYSNFKPDAYPIPCQFVENDLNAIDIGFDKSIKIKCQMTQPMNQPSQSGTNKLVINETTVSQCFEHAIYLASSINCSTPKKLHQVASNPTTWEICLKVRQSNPPKSLCILFEENNPNASAVVAKKPKSPRLGSGKWAKPLSLSLAPNKLGASIDDKEPSTFPVTPRKSLEQASDHEAKTPRLGGQLSPKSSSIPFSRFAPPPELKLSELNDKTQKALPTSLVKPTVSDLGGRPSPRYSTGYNTVSPRLGEAGHKSIVGPQTIASLESPRIPQASKAWVSTSTNASPRYFNSLKAPNGSRLNSPRILYAHSGPKADKQESDGQVVNGETVPKYNPISLNMPRDYYGDRRKGIVPMLTLSTLGIGNLKGGSGNVLPEA